MGNINAYKRLVGAILKTCVDDIKHNKRIDEIDYFINSEYAEELFFSFGLLREYEETKKMLMECKKNESNRTDKGVSRKYRNLR